MGRNSQLYLGRERSSAGGTASKGNKRGDQPQVLFLRSISLSPEAASPKGSERMIVQAMDELDRATLDPRVSETASSRYEQHPLPSPAALSLIIELCVAYPPTLLNTDPRPFLSSQSVPEHPPRCTHEREGHCDSVQTDHGRAHQQVCHQTSQAQCRRNRSQGKPSVLMLHRN